MTNVLVLGAAGPAGINFLRALREGSTECYVVALDSNVHHLKLVETQDLANHCYIQASTESADHVREVNELIDKHHIDVVHAQPDTEVRFLSKHRDSIKGKKLLPPHEVIEICQDKYRSGKMWIEAGVRDAWIENGLTDWQLVNTIQYPCWIRATRGAGGRGSTPAANADVARAWIDYWRARGKNWEFIAEELLPGRNVAVQMLWHAGELVAAVGRERLEYIYPYLAPSGITGTPSVARTLGDDDVAYNVASRAVLAIDPEPNGLYSVDMKGNTTGDLQPTEINAGRCFTTSLLTARLGINVPEAFVRIASGQRARINEFRSVKPNTYYIRHMDSLPLLADGEHLKDWMEKVEL